MDLFTDDYALARVWLSDLTETQLTAVTSYVLARGAAVREEMRLLRSMAAAPPRKAYLDMGASAEPRKLWYLVANFEPFVTADWLASDMSVPDYYEIFVKGAGIPAEMAHKLAEEVVTPDGAISNFSRRAIQSVLDLPVVRDMEVLQKIGDVVAESAATIIDSIGVKNRGKDNSWEGVLAGEKLYEMAQRSAFMTGQYTYEGLIHGKAGAPSLPATAAPAAAEMHDPFEAGSPHYGFDETGTPYNFTTALYDAIGMPQRQTEEGDPMPVSTDRMAAGRAAIADWLDDLNVATPTPYHAYAMRRPEEGGLFGSLFSGIKKAAKKAMGFVAPIAKAAMPVTGMMLGGPLGALAGGALSKGLSSLTSGAHPHASVSAPALVRAQRPLHSLFVQHGGGGARYSPLAAPVRPSYQTFDANTLLAAINQLLAQQR